MNLGKLIKLIKGDLFLLFKYGIFFVYAIFIAIYLIILHYIPFEPGTFVMKLLVFSDPAAMGLVFMGAVVLLEKSQSVNCSLAVSPVTSSIYIVSKSVSFLISGLAVALIIAYGSGRSLNLAGIIGVIGASLLFSMCGLFIACKTKSLNQFIVWMLPVELFIGVGLFFPFGKLTSPIWIIHPGIASIRLLFGSDNLPLIFLSALSLLAWITLVFFLTKKSVDKMFATLGGGAENGGNL